MTCSDCGRKPAQEGYEICFRCRVATVGYNWHGGGHMHGRHNFASRTNREYIAEHVPEGAAHMGSGDWKG